MARVQTGNSCRHYLGLYPDDRAACARGWNVRKWAVLGNNGSEFGIGLRLPCTKQYGEKPLFDCPSLCRKTSEDLARERAKMSAAMDKLVRVMPILNEIKELLITSNTSQEVTDCPWCEDVDVLQVSVALGVNNHMHAKCSSCGKGVME